MGKFFNMFLMDSNKIRNKKVNEITRRKYNDKVVEARAKSQICDGDSDREEWKNSADSSSSGQDDGQVKVELHDTAPTGEEQPARPRTRNNKKGGTGKRASSKSRTSKKKSA